MADRADPSEFELIKTYFQRDVARADIPLAIGDDAALVAPPPGQWLAVAIDTLVGGVHFPENTAPADIGYKAVAVNLSDIAAMGAQPSWMTLALTLPRAERVWLEAFAQGLFDAAQPYDVALIGGDTTRGPLTISIQIAGYVAPGFALRRGGAKVGDLIYVSGTLGDAGFGLDLLLGRADATADDVRFAIDRLNRPSPRVALGVALRGLAHSAIDASDGLAADLGHILEASGAGATLDLERLPLSPALQRLAPEIAQRYALYSGDDYELCFTCAPLDAPRVAALASQLRLPLTRIGVIDASSGLRGRTMDGQVHDIPLKGYNHFR